MQLKASPTPAWTNSSWASWAELRVSVGGAWPQQPSIHRHCYFWGWNCIWAMRLNCNQCGPISMRPHLAPPAQPSLTQHGCACRCTAWRRGGRAPAARRCRSRWSLHHVTATVGEQDKAGSHHPTGHAQHLVTLLPQQLRPTLPVLILSPLIAQLGWLPSSA